MTGWFISITLLLCLIAIHFLWRKKYQSLKLKYTDQPVSYTHLRAHET